jgi:hypothetical protein
MLLVGADEVRRFLDDWAPAAEAGVALGTILLAFATWKLARHVAAQLKVGERPCVYPITPAGPKWAGHLGEGGRWLAFRNGGSGIARDIRGHIWWHKNDGGHDDAALLGQTLGGNDYTRLRLAKRKAVERWWGLEGYLVYEDVRGDQWQSRFRYEYSGGEVWARLTAWARTKKLGDPDSAFPRPGWVDEYMPNEPEPEPEPDQSSPGHRIRRRR